MGNVARFARKVMYLSLKLGVFSRVEIWPNFVDKDKFLRSDTLRHFFQKSVNAAVPDDGSSPGALVSTKLVE